MASAVIFEVDLVIAVARLGQAHFLIKLIKLLFGTDQSQIKLFLNSRAMFAAGTLHPVRQSNQRIAMLRLITKVFDNLRGAMVRSRAYQARH